MKRFVISSVLVSLFAAFGAFAADRDPDKEFICEFSDPRVVGDVDGLKSYFEGDLYFGSEERPGRWIVDGSVSGRLLRRTENENDVEIVFEVVDLPVEGVLTFENGPNRCLAQLESEDEDSPIRQVTVDFDPKKKDSVLILSADAAGTTKALPFAMTCRRHIWPPLPRD